MIAPFTALFSRTMRLDTRAYATHVRRMALGLLVLLTLMATEASSSLFGAAGLHLLSTLAFCSAGFITLAGLSMFSSVIAEEKEEQTIGLLRMAGLRPLAILLAKCGARLVDVLMLVGVLVPFALLAVTLGGVSATQVMACIVALGAYIFLLANVGLLLSVVRPTSQSASSWMSLTLLVTQLLPPLFWQDPTCRAIADASVWARLSAILTTGYAGGVIGVQTWSSVGVGALAFLCAWWLFDRCVHDEDAQAPDRLVARATSRLRLFGMARPPAGLAAVVWKDFHFACGGRAMSVIKPLLMVALIVGVVLFSAWVNPQTEYRYIGETTQIIALMWLAVEFAIHLSHIFALESRWQTVASLLGLPYTATALAYAKLRACLLALLPAVGVLALGVGLAPDSFIHGAKEVLGSLGGWMAIASLVFFWHLCAFFSLALRRGALAAAVAAMIAVYISLMMVMGLIGMMGSVEVVPVFTILILSTLSLVMHVNIAGRLVAKGGQ